jgi:hypothetical protein
LRSAGRLVRLAQRTTAERLEQACARAPVYGVSDYPTIKRILQAGLWPATRPDACCQVCPSFKARSHRCN